MTGFLSIVGESINEREIRKFDEGLSSKVKLKTFVTGNASINVNHA